MIEVADRVKLQKFLGKAPCIAPAVNADGLPLHFRQKLKQLLDSGRLQKKLLHLFGRNIGKVGTIYFFEQLLFVIIQITDKIRQPQRKGVSLIGRRQVTVGINKTLSCHFPLCINFILGSFHTFQKFRIVVFFLGIKIAVILNQFPDPFFYF